METLASNRRCSILEFFSIRFCLLIPVFFPPLGGVSCSIPGLSLVSVLSFFHGWWKCCNSEFIPSAPFQRPPQEDACLPFPFPLFLSRALSLPTHPLPNLIFHPTLFLLPRNFFVFMAFADLLLSIFLGGDHSRPSSYSTKCLRFPLLSYK